MRVQTNRLAEAPAAAAAQGAAHRVFAQLSTAPWAGRHHVVIGQDEAACLHVKFASIKTLPPVGKQKRYGPQLLTYIHALEINPPAGRLPIDWRLMTIVPVADLPAAVEKLGWYALRWKVEVFHKVMKSGCRAERLTKFLAFIAVVSWRIFFLTMSARSKPDAVPGTVLTTAEIAALDRVDASRAKPHLHKRTLATYLYQFPWLSTDWPNRAFRLR